MFVMFGFDVLRDFFSNFSFFSSFIALVAGLIVAIVLGYKGAFKRSFILYRLFTGLYYLYIPLSFFVVMSMHTGIKVFEASLLSSLERSRERIVDESLKFTDFAIQLVKRDVQQGKVQVTQLRAAVTDSFSSPSAADLELPQSSFMEYITHPEYVVAFVKEKLQQDLAIAIADEVELAVAKNASADSKIQEDSVENFLSRTLRGQMEDGLAVELLAVLLKKRVGQLYELCTTYWFIALSFPFIESLLYALYLRRKRKQAVEKS